MQKHARVDAGWAPVFASHLVSRFGLAVLAACAFAGCSANTGSFDVDESPQAKWNNLMALVQFKPLPKQPKPTDPILCPEIGVLDGTSADRVYAPGNDQSNAAVRYQFSIDDVARDCQVNGGRVAMKIGVAGRILLGPAGTPGTYPAPIRVAIINVGDGTPVVSKLYQVPASVNAAQSEAPFTLVTDPLSVPAVEHFAQNYTIKVGFDSAGNSKKRSDAETASADANAPAPSSSDAAPHGHHHHHGWGSGASSGGGAD